MRRREFLKLLAVSVAAPTAIVTALAGEKKDSYISVAEAKTFYVDSSTPVRVYALEEITDNPTKADEPRREVSWITKDVDLIPEVGSIILVEHTGGVSPNKKVGTLGRIGVTVVRFRARVTKHEVVTHA